MFPCAPLEVFSRILGLNRSACRCDGVTGVTGCGVNFSVLSGVPTGRTRPKKGAGLFPTATPHDFAGEGHHPVGQPPSRASYFGPRRHPRTAAQLTGLLLFFKSVRLSKSFENAMLIIGGLTLQSLTFKSGQTPPILSNNGFEIKGKIQESMNSLALAIQPCLSLRTSFQGMRRTCHPSCLSSSSLQRSRSC